ncbi:peptidoglycan-binding protein [Kitasatospora sp. NPDC059673]|uniref:peptidoglycan-binding protein n=1 Tax=Kitasatospora sp. NPDC059673 TaxID=3346901 RepID=UPI0036D0B7D4
MVDTSRLDQLGAALYDFIDSQFAQPSDGPTTVAFLPGAVAVRPDTFYQNGVVNPALVGTWLTTVVDRVAPVLNSQFSAGGATAGDIMTAVTQLAAPAAPVGSDTANAFVRLKEESAQAIGPVGAPKEIRTAPLDWYAPDRVASWPGYQSTRSVTAPGPDASDQPPSDAGPDAGNQSLWSWRRDDGSQSDQAAAAPATNGSDSDENPPAASPTPVGASALTLTMNYFQVAMSRSGWWNDVLLNSPLWYLPGERAGSLLPGSLPVGTPFGLPVTMILTANVEVSGQWTGDDLAAATTSTHFGPWQLPTDPFGPGEVSAESAVLSIPDMQVIAFVCQMLPVLPPVSDPALPAAPPRQYQPFPGTDFFSPGRRSSVIAAMHNRLVAVGCGRYRSTVGEDIWGSGDQASYHSWQLTLGYQGSAADGIPGQASWDSLQVPFVTLSP